MMLSRRQFLQTGTVAVVTMAAQRRGERLFAQGPAAESAKASALIAGKSASLRIHTANPLVLESPLATLNSSPVTPVEGLFVRNNADAVGGATTSPVSDPSDWRVEISGLSGGNASVAWKDIAELPRREVEMVLQCSGNGRSMFTRAAKTSGTQWGRGGIGNVVFGGPRLSDLLDSMQVRAPESARYLAAEGRDAPRAGESDFEHSVPLEDALDRAMLALTLNGKPLPAIHGGPVRFVLPGYYGTVQMKWLGRLRFEDEESANEHHAVRYRTPHRLLKPGEAFAFDRSNSSPTWKIKLASLVTSHEEGQEVAVGPATIAGYAWNDGAAALEAVLVSTDRGEIWRRAELTLNPSPYGWSRWLFHTELSPGANTIWMKATDALGRSQPMDGAVFWNPGGYEWCGVERLTLRGVG